MRRAYLRSSARKRRPTPSRPPLTRRIVQYLLVVTCGLLILNALVGERGWLASRAVRDRHDQLRHDLTRLRRANEGLRAEARRLREDPRAIEEVARRELGLLKPGELVFVLNDPPSRPR